MYGGGDHSKANKTAAAINVPMLIQGNVFLDSSGRSRCIDPLPVNPLCSLTKQLWLVRAAQYWG